MIRLLGVITGSALAVATLLLFIGIPEFKSDAVQAERTPVRRPLPTQAVEQPEPVPGPGPAQDARLQAEAAAGAEPDSAEAGPIAAAASPAATAAPAEAGDDDAVAATRQPAPAPQPTPADEDGWYAFWTPFKSRIAAEGFVARLQSVTGLDYRIVRREPGAWEVSFSYREDDDIVRHLSTISAATGLDLPETP